jgi:hypothetical protein
MISVVAEGAEWVYIGESDIGEKHYLKKDTANILPKNIIRLWNKVTYSDRNNKYKEVVTYMEWDCKEGKNRLLKFTAYPWYGSPETMTPPSKWRYPVLNTAEYDIYRIACTNAN